MGILDNDVAEIGLEASGIIQARGTAIEHLSIGDRVAFLCPGSFATSRILPGALCVKLDPAISFEEGATIPCVYVTAMMALVDKGNLRKGQVRGLLARTHVVTFSYENLDRFDPFGMWRCRACCHSDRKVSGG
jgi:Zn-dependent alcohol dehydrogenase